MTYSIQKLNDNFPVYCVKNFKSINSSLRSELISLIVECKERNHLNPEFGGSFEVDEDKEDFFKNLYNDFNNLCSQLFGTYTKKNVRFTNPSEIEEQDTSMPEKGYLVWSYCSNKDFTGNIPGAIHNHNNTATINSVYYVNIPDSVTQEKGSINFHLNNEIFTYKPDNEDFLIFPNYLDHSINNYSEEDGNTDEWRVSVNMEIICEETSEELFGRLQ